MSRRKSSHGKSPRRRNVVLGFDEFGFAVLGRKDVKISPGRCHEYSYPRPNAVKVKELCHLLSYWNGSSFICKNQIEQFIKIGLPPELRGRAWKSLLDVESVKGGSPFNYQNCLKEIRRPLVDLGVTEYSIRSAITILSETENEMRCTEDGPNPSCEFTNSDVVIFRQVALDLRMSYLAAVLLMHLSEEEAFWALVILLERPKYLSGLFDHSLHKIQHNAKVFQQLLKHRMPQLSQHIEGLGVSSLHYVMPWFLTLFTSLPCWDSVLAVWDLLMLHGIAVVFRTGLCIFQLLEPRLLRMPDMSLLLPTLLRVPVDVSRYSALVPALWNTEVQEWEIDCMHSLVLEEDREERCPEPVEGAPKSLFAKVLDTARRYLGDTGKEDDSREMKNLPIHRSPIVPSRSKPCSFSSLRRGQIKRRKKINSSVKDSSQRLQSQGLVTVQSQRNTITSSMDLDGEITGDRTPDSSLRRKSSGPANRPLGWRTQTQRVWKKSPKPQLNKAPLSPLLVHQAPKGSSRISAPEYDSLLEATDTHSREPSPRHSTLSKTKSSLENAQELQLI
ncbi:TBC1 domain family member 10A isoform X2 [Lepisosteus oculatus]|uniref:TBC1 domain family member 10A isoform X2 n=1 Tax=Lepisosteus oculatus TaxID=7918 RepID=UPI0007401140|nr:PREDICTED: TBC1 domain family member 10A-like isoform X2 [Lepisosteus oculatus]